MNYDEMLQQAENCMKQHDFAQASRLFQDYLQARPNDIKAMLEFGICCFVNRSEQTFLAIFEQAGKRIAAMKSLPEDIARLWEKYNSLVKKASITALVVGVSMSGACQREQQTVKPTNNEQNIQQPDKQDPPYSAHRYSGGVYLPPKQDVKPVEPKPGDDTYSAHKYSGGVYLDPKDLIDDKAGSSKDATADASHKSISPQEPRK